MTPKEKAEELLLNFRYYLAHEETGLQSRTVIKELSKVFALIAVDEIMNIDCEDMSEEPFNNHIEYWQKVKNEINKL